MKAEGKRKLSIGGLLVALIIIAAAIFLVIVAVQMSEEISSTDAAVIEADVVHIAPNVGGRIIKFNVEENAAVKRNDLLFQIDPVPYQLDVDQAAAELAVAQANLESKRRALSSQRSNADVAADQVKRAEANYALADRTVIRLTPLAAKGYIPRQQLDQAQTQLRDATTGLAQAREQYAASVRAIDTDHDAVAAVQAREAALANARRRLDDTTVRAPNDGRIVGLKVTAGEMVGPSQSLFTLVNTEEWFAVGNFRETDLKGIHVGKCAVVYSMIDRTRKMKGVVQGINTGVSDSDTINLPKSLPSVERSVNWVRVAQRFPVRVRIENPPEYLVRSGASAVVEVRHDDECE